MQRVSLVCLLLQLAHRSEPTPSPSYDSYPSITAYSLITLCAVMLWYVGHGMMLVYWQSQCQSVQVSSRTVIC